MKKRLLSLALSICMALTLLPATALAASPAAPTGLSIEVGEHYQTLPVLTWNRVTGANNYNIAIGTGEDSSGGTILDYYKLSSSDDSLSASSTVTTTQYSVNAESADGKSADTILSCNVTTSLEPVSTAVRAIHSSVTLGGSTYQLYTFSGLPANTTVKFEYGEIKNTYYSPKMSDAFETNSDGVLVFSDNGNGFFELGDGAVGADDYYSLSTFTDTSVVGTTVSFTQTRYPVVFDFSSTTTGTQALSFASAGTQSLARGNTLQNIATNSQTDGGSVVYFANHGNCRVDPTTGVVTPTEPVNANDTFAYIYAYAAAVEGKYPAAIARYGVNISWSDQIPQSLSWNDNSSLTAVYGGTVVGHTATNASSGGEVIVYSSSNENVAMVDSATGAVTVKGSGTTNITATAAAVEGKYSQASIYYTLTVSKKDVTVTADNAARKFGQANPAFTATVPGGALVGTDVDADLAVGLTTTATTASNAGSYAITGTAGSANYAVAVTPGTLTVTKADAPLVSNTTKSLLYNAVHTDVTVNINGLPADRGTTSFTAGAATGDTGIIDGTVTITANGIQFSTNTGTKNQFVTIPVTVTMQNYEAVTVNVIVTLVDKTPVTTITGVTVVNKTYDGIAAAYTGTPANEQGYTGTYEYVWSSGTAPEDSGSYTLTVKIPEDDANYIGELKIPFTIAQKPLTAKPQDISIYNTAALPTAFTMEYVGIVSGDTITPSGTPEYALKNGADTLTSSTNGTYSIEWTNKDAVTITHKNYVITKADGTLTISSKPSYGGGGTTTTTPTAPKVSTVNGVSTATVDAQVAKSGSSATASVTDSAMTAAVEAAVKAATENNMAATVKIQATTSASAEKIEFSVPKTALTSFAGSTAETLSLVSGIGEISMSAQTAASIAKQAGGSEIVMSVGLVDTQQSLNAQQQAAVADAPVYDISITSGGSSITGFDGKTITVSLPYKLKDGEDPSGVVVWYVNSQGNLQNVTSSYDKATGTVTFTTNHLSLYAVGYDAFALWSNPFSDVSEDAWYYDAVRYVNHLDMMSGTSNTAFSPDMTTTRGMLVTILYRLEATPTTSGTSFTDVAGGEWYADAVAWAVKNGVADGYGGGSFGPTDSITREQMAVILMNYAKFKGYDTTADANCLSSFSDASAVSSWASDAMQWAVSKGLITGKSGTVLDPGGIAGRNQVAVILMRFCEMMEK